MNKYILLLIILMSGTIPISFKFGMMAEKNRQQSASYYMSMMESCEKNKAAYNALMLQLNRFIELQDRRDRTK